MSNPQEPLFIQQNNWFNHVDNDHSVAERIRKLKALKAWLKANQSRVCKALYADYRKSETESVLSEIKPLVTELKDALRNIHHWTSPKRVSAPLVLLGTNSKVEMQPKGVVLIIAPWNFPFMLAVGPLVSAIAAGCNAIVKPSEMTPNVAQLLQEMVAELFEEKEIAVVQGDSRVAQELTVLPFHHIFFTGSPAVGKHIMRAAAENLTGVTLELGGTNPAILDRGENLARVAEKIVWGKFLNCGQSCLTVNYLFVHESEKEDLVAALRKVLVKHYGQNGEGAKTNSAYIRIVNAHHTARVQKLLATSKEEGAKVLYGGEVDATQNYISPTVLEVDSKSIFLKEEIFGPLLPILTYKDHDEALALQANNRPLAFYVFSKRRNIRNYYLKHTTAGTTVFNDTTIQFAHPHLPFGGINNSGIGNAHGHYGFMAITNERSVLKQRRGRGINQLVYPPYTGFKKKLIRFIAWWM